MLRTSSSLAQSEEGALLRKLRESPALAQSHVHSKLTCETGEGDGGQRRWGALNPEKPPCAPRGPPASFGRRGRGTVRQCQVLWPGPSGIEICTRRPAMLTEQKTSTASSLPAMEK